MLGKRKKKFYFNTKTSEVEEGRRSDWTQLLGPYPTREAAEHALETAQRRAQTWDEQDKAWHGDPPHDDR